MSNDLPCATHYAPVRFGNLSIEGVVLSTGASGYVQRQIFQALGLHVKNQSNRFRQILTEIAPNALILLEKSESPVIMMPSRGKANFAPAGILTEIAGGVIDAALDGRLHSQRRAMLEPCRIIYRALARVGEEALIHEATGYQHHRAPDALQDLFAKLIRQSAADWERRFHPDFYESIYRLFGWGYDPAKPKPFIVGRITLEWVYEPVFPADILVEIKERQGSAKMHQWLQEGGLALLEKQKNAVMMIARSSVDYRDFENRCSVAFFKRGQMPILYPREAA